MTKHFFTYDPGGMCFEPHDTLEEAKASAEDLLSSYRDYAEDGWSEEVTHIIYGEVRGGVVETERMSWSDHLVRHDGVTPEEAAEDEPHEFSTYVDYALKEAHLSGEDRERLRDDLARKLRVPKSYLFPGVMFPAQAEIRSARKAIKEGKNPAPTSKRPAPPSAPPRARLPVALLNRLVAVEPLLTEYLNAERSAVKLLDSNTPLCFSCGGLMSSDALIASREEGVYLCHKCVPAAVGDSVSLDGAALYPCDACGGGLSRDAMVMQLEREEQICPSCFLRGAKGKKVSDTVSLTKRVGLCPKGWSPFGRRMFQHDSAPGLGFATSQMEVINLNFQIAEEG